MLRERLHMYAFAPEWDNIFHRAASVFYHGVLLFSERAVLDVERHIFGVASASQLLLLCQASIHLSLDNGA